MLSPESSARQTASTPTSVRPHESRTMTNPQIGRRQALTAAAVLFGATTLTATSASAAPGRVAQGYRTGTQYVPGQQAPTQWTTRTVTAPSGANVTTTTPVTATTTATTTTATTTATLGQSVANGTYGTASAALIAQKNLQNPLPGASISYGFGPRSFNGTTDNHTGIDFVANQGTAVRAAGAGTVTFAGWHSYGGGNRVEVSHGNGVVTSYNHLSSDSVSVGQTVAAGQTIAAVGSTGNSTGPHLHFEVIVNGAWTDPAPWIA